MAIPFPALVFLAAWPPPRQGLFPPSGPEDWPERVGTTLVAKAFATADPDGGRAARPEHLQAHDFG